jgi:hypothetical protein
MLYGFSFVTSAVALSWFSIGDVFGISEYTRLLVTGLITSLAFVLAIRERRSLVQKTMIGATGYSAVVFVAASWSTLGLSGGESIISLVALSLIGSASAKYFDKLRNVQTKKYYVILGFLALATSLVFGADVLSGKPETTIQVKNSTGLSTDTETKIGTLKVENSFFFPKRLEEPDIESKICGGNVTGTYTQIEDYGYREKISGTEEFAISSEITPSRRSTENERMVIQDLTIQRDDSCNNRTDVLLVSTSDLGGRKVAR